LCVTHLALIRSLRLRCSKNRAANPREAFSVTGYSVRHGFEFIKGVFSPKVRTRYFFTNLPSSPHMSSHMFGHHPATVRLAGRKRHARFESSEALAELPAVARTAVELHGCCARVSLAAALLSQHIDGMARAGSAGTKRAGRARAPWSCSPCWRPSSRTARFGDQLGLDDEANSEIIADRYATGSSARRGVAVGDLPTSSVSAVQLIPEKACLEQTHPVRDERCNLTAHAPLGFAARFFEHRKRNERIDQRQVCDAQEDLCIGPGSPTPGPAAAVLARFVFSPLKALSTN
jgi:hypothetical protein